MAEWQARAATLSPERRRLLDRLAGQTGAASRAAAAPPPAPLDLNGAFDPNATPDDIKTGYITFYDQVTGQLDSSPFGQFSFFLNYGYVPDLSPQCAAVRLPDHYVNKNSVRLVLETIADCDVAGKRVLDVGCGRGGTVFTLEEFFRPAMVYGIDLSPAAIAFCRRTHRYANVQFEQGDAEHLPFGEASMDVVTNIESSHTYPDIDRFYAEVARVLVPGGWFLYTDICAVDALPARLASLTRLGFTLERQRDITANVLRSCDEVALSRGSAFATDNDPALMQNFLAMPGSFVYDNLSARRWIYYILTLRRPHARARTAESREREAVRARTQAAWQAQRDQRRPSGCRSGPLGLAQQRLWIFEQLMPGTACYNETNVQYVDGLCDRAAVSRAIAEIVRRHEILRTTYQVVNGEPVQVIGTPFEPRVEFTDLRGIDADHRARDVDRLARADAQEPFDLARGPMLRLRVIQEETRFALYVTTHHIVTDGWSTMVFANEFEALYRSWPRGAPSPLPELPMQYSDYARWQRESLSRGELREQLEYWTKELTDCPVLNLPTDRPRPPRATFRGAWVSCAIPPALHAGIERFASRSNVTVFVTLLAAFTALLSRYTGQDDIAVGVPTANRGRKDIQPLIGFFVNTMVIRTRLADDATFAALLATVRDRVYAALAHQEAPFERIVEVVQPERDLSRNPLFQVSLQLVLLADDHVPRAEAVDVGTSKFDLRVDIGHGRNGMQAWIEYSTDLFERSTVERFSQHYLTLLEGAIAEPNQRVSQLPLMTPAERDQTLEVWSRSPDPSVARTDESEVRSLVEVQVRQRPDAVAVADGRRSLTYAQLDAWADRLARRLRAAGVQRGDLVALLLDRSVALVAGMLATWKAGSAFLPLDRHSPAARLAAILDDARPAAIVGEPGGHSPIAELPMLLATHDEDGAGMTPPDVPLEAADVAYVIYTSGSTGTPRGVEIEHRSLANLIAWYLRRFDLRAGDRTSQVANPAFDATVWEIFPALSAGASVHFCPEPVLREPSTIPGWLADQRIDISFLPTPIAEIVLDEPWPPTLRLRTLQTAGDRLRHRPPASLPFRLVNNYGPTENTVCATCCDVEPDGEGLPSIGRPIDGVRAYVLDRFDQPVPVLVPGELCLGGAGLARQYRHHPELTRQKFVVHEAFGRLYRTGDLVRWRADGTLEFLGRLDDQVKIRGVRIELSEIERALVDDDAVREAVAVSREDDSGARRLIAYVVPDPAHAARDEAFADEHVSDWRQLYNQLYQQRGAHADPTFNIVGWHSSYDGLPIPDDAMREQVDGTVDRIARLAPRHLLEVGCGTGLLLFRLAPRCARYTGVDFSAAALGYIRHVLPAPSSAHVHLIESSADQLSGVHPGSVDTVVLNSTIQYFPSMTYLLRVCDRVLAAASEPAQVFVGDVLHLPLRRVLHAAVEVHRASPDASVADVRARVETRTLQDRELAVDPSLFLALRSRYPQIRRVTVQLKRGRHHNELTRFRYDVTLGLSADDLDAIEPAQSAWDTLCTFARLEAAVRAWHHGGARAFVVRGVPNARLVNEIAMHAALEAAPDTETIAAIQARLEAPREGVEPEDVWTLAERLDCEATIAYGERADQMDILFVRRGPAEACVVRGWHDRWAGAPEPHLCSTPLRQRPRARTAAAIRAHLRERLPEYMLPSSIVVLDTLPLTANGKVNVRALPDPDRDRAAAPGLAAPRSDLERQIAAIWSSLLDLDSVGIHDNFFDVGGHSLLVVRLHQRLKSDLNINVPVLELFRHPTVSAQAAFLSQPLSGQMVSAPVPRLVLTETKEACRSEYDEVNRSLDATAFGPYAWFLNYGYVEDGTPHCARVSLPEQCLNKNSIRLVLETIGDCEIDGARVLDVGCGRGGTVSVLMEYFKPASVLAVDLSAAAIAFCRNTHRHANVRFEQADAERLPCSDSAVDVVTNIESSSCYDDLSAFYREVWRVLRPGGWFLYTDALPLDRRRSAMSDLRGIGFTIVNDRDITSNVLRSCDEIASVRRGSYDGRLGGDSLATFLGAPGSANYERLRSRLWSYRILTLRRPGPGEVV